MVRRPPERRREVTRQEFGDVAECVRPGQEDIGRQCAEPHVRPAVTIRPDGGPAREEWPDRAVVIRQGIVQGALVRQQPIAPIGGEAARAKVIHFALGAIVAHRSEPQRNGRKNGVLVNERRAGERVQS